MRAAIYTRISRDRDAQGLGVTRQRDDCEQLARRNHWDIVAVHCDNDTSAYSGKPRPGYRQLCADVEAGKVDIVTAWANDRLHRHPRELEDFIALIERTRTQVVTVTSGAYDLSTPEGRAMARVVGAMARQESERKSVRNRRKHEELAAAGKPSGGGSRPFGYEPDKITVREDEAVLVKEAAARVLAGEPVATILRDWQARGITTVSGKPWWPTTLRNLLASPRIAGLRSHRGQPVGPAVWPAIISDDDHRRLVAVLTDRKRRTTWTYTRTHCLTGLLWCSRCDRPMESGRRKDRAREYRCARDLTRDGCGRMTSLAEPLETYVGAAAVDALSSGALAATIRPAWGGRDEGTLLANIRRDEDALTRLTHDHYVEQLLPRSEYLAARRALEHRLDASRTRLAEASNPVLAGLPAERGELQRLWDESTEDVSWRRALLGAVLHRVVLLPAVKGRNFFDPDRVQLDWKA